MNAKEELVYFGKRWDQAIENNRVEEIRKFMAEDWIIVGSEGGITSKSDFLASVESGDLVHTKMNFEDVLVQIYGHTGVVVSRGTSSGTYKGQFFSFYEWSASTYVKEGSEWRCVLTMLTPASPDN